MNFKKLGNTDLKVSTICLGTMTWGEQNNQKEAFEQMNYALNCGVNFFDAAEILGKKAVMGALTLYLDFINLFIMLLRLFGQRR